MKTSYILFTSVFTLLAITISYAQQNSKLIGKWENVNQRGGCKERSSMQFSVNGELKTKTLYESITPCSFKVLNYSYEIDDNILIIKDKGGRLREVKAKIVTLSSFSLVIDMIYDSEKGEYKMNEIVRETYKKIQ